jgi:hypothetical protein
MNVDEGFSSFRAAWDSLMRDTHWMVRDVNLWASRLSDGERVIGICVFALVLLFLMVRRPRDYKQGGGMGRQFAFAFVIVVIFGFGVGWLFDGRFDIPDII